jgi:hypothetical protein
MKRCCRITKSAASLLPNVPAKDVEKLSTGKISSAIKKAANFD